MRNNKMVRVHRIKWFVLGFVCSWIISVVVPHLDTPLFGPGESVDVGLPLGPIRYNVHNYDETTSGISFRGASPVVVLEHPDGIEVSTVSIVDTDRGIVIDYQIKTSRVVYASEGIGWMGAERPTIEMQAATVGQPLKWVDLNGDGEFDVKCCDGGNNQAIIINGEWHSVHRVDELGGSAESDDKKLYHFDYRTGHWLGGMKPQ